MISSVSPFPSSLRRLISNAADSEGSSPSEPSSSDPLLDMASSSDSAPSSSDSAPVLGLRALVLRALEEFVEQRVHDLLPILLDDVRAILGHGGGVLLPKIPDGGAEVRIRLWRRLGSLPARWATK